MAQTSPPKSPQLPAPAAATGVNVHCDDHKRECPFQDRPKLRWAFLIGLVVIIVAVLVVGVVFTVYYDAMYYSSGAFLLKENTGGIQGQDQNIQPVQRDLSVCGERQDSCEAFGQPNICCPVGMICHSSEFSPSGIYCCANETQCLATEAQPPRCDSKASSCGKHLGGGCCAPGAECSSDGCLKVYRAAPGFATSVLSDVPTPSTTRTSTVTTVKGTATDGVTVTTPKIGETAQSRGVKGISPGFGFSSSPPLETFLFGFAIAFAYAMVLRDG
ncbi:hypothetical protein GGR54DRAFT_634860 [Hypoxylon sp. NC1633]|nr:hypothetical protein GGR54DRAFT_634860 [Hypoxylon sp. NC1633]